MKMTDELESKVKQMDNVLRDLYVEISDEIRNSLNSIVSFVEVCASKTTYSKLPEIVKKKINSAYSAINKFQKSNKKISEIFGRLPEEKRPEYSNVDIRSLRSLTALSNASDVRS